MKFTSEFQWLESYISHDSFWLEDVLNWDETFSLVFSEYDLTSFFLTAFFTNSYFFLDSHTKIAFLDVLLVQEFSKDLFVFELFNSFMWDNITILTNIWVYSQFLFYTDYQDFFTVLLHHTPELSLALVDYIQIYWFSSLFHQTPVSVFDFFSDSTNINLGEFLENLTGQILFYEELFYFRIRFVYENDSIQAKPTEFVSKIIYLVFLEQTVFSTKLL